MGQRCTSCLGQRMPRLLFQKWDVFFNGASAARRSSVSSVVSDTKQEKNPSALPSQVENSSELVCSSGEVPAATTLVSSMPIMIQFLSGKSFEIQVPEDVRVLEVKQTISQLEFIGVHHKQRLISGTEELADADFLKSCGLGSGSHLTLVVEFGCCIKRQNPIVGIVLAALKKESLRPGSAHFQRTWSAATAPAVSDDEFDSLVKEACGVDMDPHVYSDFVKILSFWFEAGESWSMMSPQILHAQVTQYSNNMKLFKHELYRELTKEACSSVHSVTSPELAFHWQTKAGGVVYGYDLIGNPTVYPFSSNLLLHYYTPLQSILEGDRETQQSIKPCRNVTLKQILYALWNVAIQGHRRVYGANSKSHFSGHSDFNTSDWIGFISSSEAVVVNEGDMVPLLHVQTQLSAGICPVVIDKELGNVYCCLLANANGCFLKIIDSSRWLDMDKLQCFIRESLLESMGQKYILIVVAGLAAFSNHVRLCSNLCRLNAYTPLRRLSVILCVQEHK